MPKAHVNMEDAQLIWINARLFALRRRRGISQKDMAAEIGISRAAYSKKEINMNFSLREFLAVCHTLEADPSEILAGPGTQQ